MTTPSIPGALRLGRIRLGRTRPPVPVMLEHCGRSLAAWSAGHQSTGPRRRLQIALGLLWLLDAALQYQPYMFSRSFATKIISGSAAGSPGPVAAPVRLASHLMLHNIVAWNAAFATCQLAVGAALLWRPTAKAGLAGTVVWSAAVWWLGESLGGILTGAASPLTGAPGAAILYGLVALLAWPARLGDRRPPGSGESRAAGCGDGRPAGGGDGRPAGSGGRALASVADGGLLGARWSKALWLLLWAGFACLMLQVPNRAPGAVRASIASLAAGEPRWIAAMDHAAAAAAGHAGPLVPAVLAAAFAAIGIAIFIPAAVRPALTLSIILALASWVIGQNFGGILTGQATDPNAGPPLVLLALAFWPHPAASRWGAGRPPGRASTEPPSGALAAR
jgi:hypothetical protein